MRIGNMVIMILVTGVLLGISGPAYALLAQHATLTGNIITPETDKTISQYRFLHNVDCFAQQDPLTGRVNAHRIDLDKFNDDVLSTCYPVEEKSARPCYYFSLTDLSKDVQIAETQTNNFKHCRAIGALTEQHITYVQFEQEGVLKQGKLLIEVG